jgi:hypothetical protein
MWFIGIVVLLFVCTQILVFAINKRGQLQAQALLAQISTLEIGRSSPDDVLRVVKQFPFETGTSSSSDCPSADVSYSIIVGSNAVNRASLTFPFIRRIGVKPWSVVAMLQVAKGRLCRYEYSFATDNPEMPDQLITATASDSPFPCRVDVTGEKLCYEVLKLRTRIGPRLSASVFQGATVQEHHRAFDFDLSCLTMFAGCQELCQMMPSVWKDHMAEGYAPEKDVDDPRCIAVAKNTH